MFISSNTTIRNRTESPPDEHQQQAMAAHRPPSNPPQVPGSSGRSEVALSSQDFRLSQAFAGMQLDNNPTERGGGRPNSTIIDKIGRAKTNTQAVNLPNRSITLVTVDADLANSAYAKSLYNHSKKTLNVEYISRQNIPSNLEDTIPKSSDVILAQLASAENLIFREENSLPNRLPDHIMQEDVANQSTKGVVNQIVEARQGSVIIQRNHESSGSLDNFNRILNTPNGGIVRHLVNDYNSLRDEAYLVNSATVTFKHEGAVFDLGFDIVNSGQARSSGLDELHRSNRSCCSMF